MKRSLFPENVEVHQRDLERTETSKGEEIRQRASDGTRTVKDGVDYRPGGVVSGLRVTRNTLTTSTFDVTIGEAYVPNGERVVVDVPQVALSLSDYTDGVVNLICLSYVEVAATDQPHETDGTLRKTEAVPSFLLRALTATELDALAETNSTDLTIAAQDRTVVIAEILGDGLGNPIDTTEITQEALLTADAIAVEYVDPLDPIPGVNLIDHGVIIAPATPAATTSAIELSIVAGVKSIRYRQEGDAAFGVGLIITTVVGQITLTSVSGSDIILDVDANLLPSADATWTRDIVVEPIYNVVGPNHSPTDIVHRHKTGTGSRTTGNTHATGVNDLAAAFLSYLGTLNLGKGLLSSVEAAGVARLFTQGLDPAVLGAAKKTLIWEGTVPNSTDGGNLRLYIGADEHTVELTFNARYDNVSNVYRSDVVSGSVDAFQIVLGAQGSSTPQIRFGRSGSAASFGSFQEILSSRVSTTITNKAVMLLGSGLLTSAANTQIPRARADAIAAFAPTFDRVLLFEGLTSLGGLGGDTWRVYITGANTGTLGGHSLEIVRNMTYDNTGLGWNTDVAGQRWTKIELSELSIGWYSDTTVLATAADATLTPSRKFLFNLNSGDVSFEGGDVTLTTGDVRIDPTSDYTYTSSRTFYHMVHPTDFRWDLEEDFNVSAGTLELEPGDPDNPESGIGPMLRQTSGTIVGAGPVWIAPLHLPQGAIIVDMDVNYASDDPQFLRTTIARVTHDVVGAAPAPVSLLAGAPPHNILGDTGGSLTFATQTVTFDETAAIRTVDNSLYGYYIWIGFDGAGTVNSRVRLVRVRYTLTAVNHG